MLGVDPTAYITDPRQISRDVRVGPYAHIGPKCWICPRVSIGKYTLLAPDVSILGGDHRIDVPAVPIIFSGRPEVPDTIIGDDVWVGHRVIIMAGVTIGDGAIVAAGAVVTKDVPEYSVVGGIPARILRNRFQSPSDADTHREMLTLPARRGKMVSFKTGAEQDFDRRFRERALNEMSSPS